MRLIGSCLNLVFLAKLAYEISFSIINVKGNNQLDLLNTHSVGITVNV